MDYNYLSSISQSRNRNIKINQKLESRNNEKKIPSSQVASNAVQAFLARKQQEERKKYEEARKRKEQLLALRAQNSKNNKKAKIMASRTKDNDFSKIKLTEDEVEAKIRREKELNKKHLTNTVDRMRARIQLEERDNQLPRTRKKKPIDHQSQILKNNSPVEIEYKFNGNSVPIPVVVNKYKDEEKKKKNSISKTKSVPVMDYRNLLEIAAKKQYESVSHTEYEDFEEGSDEYEDDQAEISELQANNLPNYTTEKTEQVQKLNQNVKINKVLDKQKLKPNKENSYDTNNSIKNEISNSNNIVNCKQVNKFYQKDISDNSIHTKKSKSITNRDCLQKTKYSNNNSTDIINSKQKVLPKLNKYEEYIRKPVDKHNEEEYVPQFKKPEFASNKQLIQNQKQKELDIFSSHKTSTQSRTERELNNKKKTSFQIAVDKMNRNKKISGSISSNNIHTNGKYPYLRESKENLLKCKNESFKIPKRKNESVADYDNNPPCYYTDDTEDRSIEKTKIHSKMKQNSEKRSVNSIHKKKENGDKHLLNNRIHDQMPNNTKHITVVRYNSNIENKPKEKLNNSAIKRNIHKVNEPEEQKQYFTVTGEEKSKYVPSAKSLIKNRHVKTSISSNEIYQYFTEDFKKDDCNFQKTDIKSIKHNHSNSVYEKYKSKPIMNTQKINHNRSSDIRKCSYNELNETNRNESPPVKVHKNENIVKHENKMQRLEKSINQKIQKKRVPSEYETVANERLKIKDDLKKGTGITKEKICKEFSGKNLNFKIKNEDKTHRKIDDFNYIHREETKYPEYTSIQKKALNEDKSKLDFNQREPAFPKKVLSETKKVIPPSNMAHLMKKEYFQKNNDHSKFSEKLRLQNQQKLSYEKLQMATKNSENSNRTYQSQKLLKSNLNTNSNTNKYPEANSNKRKAIPSEKYIQHNDTIPNNTKNPKIKPITSSDYVGIKRDRYGRPLASMFLKKNLDSEEEEEEEEEDYDDDMADFIDDGPLEEDDEDYSRYIREIFGYDKRRYRYEDDFDDQAMESSYAEQMKEERRSARIGLLEDLEDIRKEEEEKQRKAHKKLKIK